MTFFQVHISDWLGLCKLKVVLLLVITAAVGMFLATPGLVPLDVFILGNLGIGMAASSAAAINHVLDRKIDEKMRRTHQRPLPEGKMPASYALYFAALLALISIAILYFFINPLTCFLTVLSLVGYAFFYTAYLKRATPQNIVIGGLSGAAPPLLGWTAVTGTLDPNAWLLVLIIYAWTPPHFWALAIHRLEDYKKADVPMLPVTHGVEFTKTSILLYTVLLILATLLPYLVGMSGWFYLIGTMVSNAIFLYYACKLKYRAEEKTAIKTFVFSIYYLFVVFILLLADHYMLPGV